MIFLLLITGDENIGLFISNDQILNKNNHTISSKWFIVQITPPTVEIIKSPVFFKRAGVEKIGSLNLIELRTLKLSRSMKKTYPFKVATQTFLKIKH